jgi:hypothetical protein
MREHLARRKLALSLRRVPNISATSRSVFMPSLFHDRRVRQDEKILTRFRADPKRGRLSKLCHSSSPSPGAPRAVERTVGDVVEIGVRATITHIRAPVGSRRWVGVRIPRALPVRAPTLLVSHWLRAGPYVTPKSQAARSGGSRVRRRALRDAGHALALLMDERALGIRPRGPALRAARFQVTPEARRTAAQRTRSPCDCYYFRMRLLLFLNTE